MKSDFKNQNKQPKKLIIIYVLKEALLPLKGIFSYTVQHEQRS